MTVALLVLTDGRVDCLVRTIDSVVDYVCGDISTWIIHNDSPDPLFRKWLHDTYGDEFTIVHTPARAGFGGAIRNAWSHLRTMDFDYLFATEDDFVFERPVALDFVSALLDERQDIAHVAFRRQAWNLEERQAGGVIEMHPHAYEDHISALGFPYLTHRLFFTTNCYLARRSLVERDWPKGPHSEGFFGQQLRDDGHLFAYWGARTDQPWVTHIGKERVGSGY